MATTVVHPNPDPDPLAELRAEFERWGEARPDWYSADRGELLCQFGQMKHEAHGVTVELDQDDTAALFIVAFRVLGNCALLVEYPMASRALRVTALEVVVAVHGPRKGLAFVVGNDDDDDGFRYDTKTKQFLDKGGRRLSINGTLTALYARLSDAFDATLKLVAKARRRASPAALRTLNAMTTCRRPAD